MYCAIRLMSLAPTITDPLVMISENKSWHGGPLYPNYNPSQPNYGKFYSGVRQESKMIAEWLAEASLDEETLKSSIDVSPEWLDMGYDFVTGSLGRVVADTGGMTKKLFRGEDWDFKEFPLLRKGVGEIGDSYRKTRFYDRYYEVLDIDTALRKLEGTPEYKERRKGVGERIKLIPMAKATRKQLRGLNKLYKAAKVAGDHARAQEIDDKRMAIMNKYLKRYHEVMYGR